MTRDDIIKMAREAGLEIVNFTSTIASIERFAELVAAAEREACANVCEETTASWTQHIYNAACVDCAAAIRARGTK